LLKIILYCLFVILFFGTITLIAADKDSILITLPTVTVQAERYTLSDEKKFSAFSHISSETIEQENPIQISEILNKETGIYIKNYGGLGGIQTISLRGTSSQQTLVLVEGMKFNSTQNGSLDFSTLPVTMLNSVEILRGGNSSVFGGSSIGGTLNFNLKPPNKDLKLSVGRGSFNEFTTSLTAGVNFVGTSVGIAADYINSKGNYPFTVNQFTETKEYSRTNADFKNMNLLLNAYFDRENWKIKLITMGQISERGSPGPVLLGYVEPGDGRLKEKEADIIIKAVNNIGNDIFDLGAMYKYNYQNYSDSYSSEAFRGDTISKFHSNDLQLNLHYNSNYERFKILYSLSGQFTDLRGDFLQAETNNYVSRLSSGISARIVSNPIKSESLTIPLELGGRYDLYTDVGGSPSAVAGISIMLNKMNLNLKSQAAYNYRPPSFNEMYYLNYGTVDLKPERSTSFNLTLQYAGNFIHSEINGFIINTKDQIIAVPKSPLTWSARNMASVLSRGLEIDINTSLFNKILNAGLSYTLQSVTDNNQSSATYGSQIVYVPQEMFSAKLSLNHDGYYAGFNAQYKGFTYYLPENLYSTVIPAYWLLNLNFSKLLSIRKSDLTLKFDVLNILNKQYIVIKNYPMPGRIFRLGLQYKIL